jgi:hypothetical protein
MTDDAATTDPPPETPPAEPAPPASSETNGETPGGSKPDDVDALRRSLDNERKRREKAQTELDDLRKKHMSESEKALAEARAEGRKAAMGDVTKRLLAAEVRAAAAAKMADPGDAVHLLDLDGLADDDGNIDSKGIGSRIDALLKEKPYLAKPATPRTPGKPPQGARDGANNGSGADDFLRSVVKRGRHG